MVINIRIPLALTLITVIILLLFEYPSNSLADSSALLTATPITVSCPLTQRYDIFSVSQDGKYLLVSWSSFNAFSADASEIRLWDIETGDLLTVFTDSAIESYSIVDISPDNNYVLTAPSYLGSDSKTVILWNTFTGKKLQTFEMHNKPSYLGTVIRFSSDGNYIILTDSNESYIWDIAKGTEIHSFSHNLDRDAFDLSPDSQHAFIVDESSFAKIWDVNTEKEIYRLEGVNTGSFSPDGRFLLTKGVDGYILWDTDNYQKHIELSNSADTSIEFGTFSPDSNYLMGWERQGDILIVDTQTGKLLHRFTSIIQPYAQFFPDGKKLMFIEAGDVYNGSILTIRDIASGKELHSISIGDGYHYTIGFSITPDSKYIITGFHSERLRIWDIETGKLLHEFC